MAEASNHVDVWLGSSLGMMKGEERRQAAGAHKQLPVSQYYTVFYPGDSIIILSGE